MKEIKRDPRILQDDLYISERNLHKYDYERKIVGYIKERRDELKGLVHLLDESVWYDGMEFIIYTHFHYAHSLWTNGSITKEMMVIFHDYVEYVAEAVVSVYLSHPNIYWEQLYKETQNFLIKVEHSHYNISNSS
jgi:hypothetical protein